MAKKKPKRENPGPRKLRPREHIIASQSASHVENIVNQVGFTAELVKNDYGYDILLFTFDEEGYAEEGAVYLQLKATDSIKITEQGISFSIDVRDYNLWMREPMPVFLIVFDATTAVAYWLYLQHYFESDRSRRPARTVRKVRVNLPLANVVNGDFVLYARDRKRNVLDQLSGRIQHHG